MNLNSKSIALVTLLTVMVVPAANAASLWGEKTEATVGAGVLFAPRYAGSDDAQAVAMPVLSAQRGMFFFDTTRGLGLQYQFESGLYLSQSVYYDLGRLDKDSSWRPGSDSLLGMGRVPGSVTTKILALQPIGDRVSLSAEAEYALKSATHRLRYRVGGEFKVFGGNADSVFITADIHGGDKNFNQAYYGVSAEQSVRTNRSSFSADAGVYAFGSGVRWEHKFSDRWMATAQVTSLRYANDISDSSVIERKSNVVGNVALTYTY